MARSSTSMAQITAMRLSAGMCVPCGKEPIAVSRSKRECEKCLAIKAARAKVRLASNSAKWIHKVGVETRRVAVGHASFASSFPWNHSDFCVNFLYWRGKEDARLIDHVIARNCAIDLDGEIDRDFAKVALDLPNLQLLSYQANNLKSKTLDKVVIQRSKDLRAFGLTGSVLFFRLFDQFSSQAFAFRKTA